MSIVKNLVIGIFGLSIVAAIGLSVYKKQNPDNNTNLFSKNLITVKGVITSEKESFFQDERTIKILNEEGIDFQYERWSSGKIAQVTNISEFKEFSDFIFPSGVQTSDKIKSNLKGAQAYNIFYSPMIIATWTPIVNILEKNNLIKKSNEFTYFKVDEFLKLADKKVKWKDLKNSEEYPVNKNVLVYTSDSRFSNASKMFIGLTSYLYNNSEIVQNEEHVQKVLPNIKAMMNAQGHRDSSSTNLFTDYTSIGMGKTPMVFLYESEFLEYAFKNGQLAPKMTFMYPTPTLFTKHVLVGFNDKSKKLVDVLTQNDKLKKVAAEYGFRFSGNNDLSQKAKTFNINIPETVIDVIDPPSFDILDSLANQVEQK